MITLLVLLAHVLVTIVVYYVVLKVFTWLINSLFFITWGNFSFFGHIILFGTPIITLIVCYLIDLLFLPVLVGTVVSLLLTNVRGRYIWYL